MPRDSRRADRVAEAIREEVASYLATGVKDPRITGFVTVTGVDVTPDLRHARVYVSIWNGADDEGAADGSRSDDAADQAAETTVEALNDIGRRLKGEVGRALRLRLAPELEFRRDQTVTHASRIESLLAQLKGAVQSDLPNARTGDDRRDD